jgi:CheY-like chemotaxis protein
MPALDGLTILIVESDARFLRLLQKALGDEGASTLAVSDPNSVAGARRITQSIFSAAVVNDWHRRAAYTLRDMPALIYGGTTPVPAQVDAIVGELKAVLGK